MSLYLDQVLDDNLNDLEEVDFEDITPFVETPKPSKLSAFKNMINGFESINYKPTNFRKYEKPIFSQNSKEDFVKTKESVLFSEETIFTDSPVYIDHHLRDNIRNSLTQESSIKNYAGNVVTATEETHTVNPFQSSQDIKSTSGSSTVSSIFKSIIKQEKPLFDLHESKSTTDSNILIHTSETTIELAKDHIQQTVKNLTPNSKFVESTFNTPVATKNITSLSDIATFVVESSTETATNVPHTSTASDSETSNSIKHITDKITEIVQNITADSNENTTTPYYKKHPSTTINTVLTNLQSSSVEGTIPITSDDSEDTITFKNIIDAVTNSQTSSRGTFFNTNFSNHTTSNDLPTNNFIPTSNSTVSRTENYFNTLKTSDVTAKDTNVTENVTSFFENTTATITDNYREYISKTVKDMLTNLRSKSMEHVTTTATTNPVITSPHHSVTELQTITTPLKTTLSQQEILSNYLTTELPSTLTRTETTLSQQGTVSHPTFTDVNPTIKELFSSMNTTQNYTNVSESKTVSEQTTEIVQNIADTYEESLSTVKNLLTDLREESIEQATTIAARNSTKTNVFEDTITAVTDLSSKFTDIETTLSEQEIISDSTSTSIPSIMKQVFSYGNTARNYSDMPKSINVSDQTIGTVQGVPDNYEGSLTTVKSLLADFRDAYIEHTTTATRNSTEKSINYSVSNLPSTITNLKTDLLQNELITDSYFTETTSNYLGSSETVTEKAIEIVNMGTTTYKEYLPTIKNILTDLRTKSLKEATTITTNFIESSTLEDTTNIVTTETPLISDLNDSFRDEVTKLIEDTSITNTENTLTPMIENILNDLHNKSLQYTKSTSVPKFKLRFGDFIDSDEITEAAQETVNFTLSSENVTSVISTTVNTTLESDTNSTFDQQDWVVYIALGFVSAVVILSVLGIFIFIYIKNTKKYSEYRLTRTRDISSV